jgi:hypothetical protein
MPNRLQPLLPNPWTSLVLALLILLTRSQHFGTPYTPPDATWGAFFLAGLFAPSALLFVVLLAVSALADQIAFASGVSAWCVTAAYAFLVPTYGVMWLGGYFCRSTRLLSLRGAGQLAGTLLVCSVLAFVVSSGSFFFFSGYFPTMPALEYTQRVLRYVPSYVGWASAYALGGIAVAVAWPKYWPARKQPRTI